MSVTRKIAHKAGVASGAARKTAGRVTGSRRPRAEGRTGQAQGHVN